MRVVLVTLCRVVDPGATFSAQSPHDSRQPLSHGYQLPYRIAPLLYSAVTLALIVG
jgi:hypothetical protein